MISNILQSLDSFLQNRKNPLQFACGPIKSPFKLGHAKKDC